MKKVIPCLLVATVLVAGTASVSADHGGHMDSMAEKLELTSEQEAQFREIMQTKREKKKSFFKELRADTHAQLEEVLTEEQLAEFEEMSKHRCPRKGKQ